MEAIKIIKTAQIIFILVWSLQLVQSANVGVSPANILFENVLRGGYAERSLIVTIDVDEPVNVEVETMGNLSNWISFSEGEFTVSKNSPKQFTVSVTPPIDTPNGVYEGFIRIKSTALSNTIQEGGATGRIIPTLDVQIAVEVTDQEFISCKATDFKVLSAEEGDDVIFTMRIQNNGNIRFNPRISLDVWDQESINIIKQFEYSDTTTTPTKREELIIRMPSDDLEIGQYWVDINSLECYNRQTLTFDILQEGALRANGILENIVVQNWAEIGDLILITANFKNNGEKPLDARFKGKIMHNNKVIQLIESEEDIFVSINEIVPFQFYFNPREAGRYVISGRVFYDGKRTYEQNAILNVNPEGIWSKLTKAMIYIILIIIISYLLYRIRQERKSYSRRLRRLRRR